MGTRCAVELQYCVLQSRQLRLQCALQARCPVQEAQKRSNAWRRQDKTDAAPPCSDVAGARLHFTHPEWECLKGPFLQAFQCRPLLFCEVKLKLMTDMTL